MSENQHTLLFFLSLLFTSYIFYYSIRVFYYFIYIIDIFLKLSYCLSLEVNFFFFIFYSFILLTHCSITHKAAYFTFEDKQNNTGKFAHILVRNDLKRLTFHIFRHILSHQRFLDFKRIIFITIFKQIFQP
jgi:hypothetical protein